LPARGSGNWPGAVASVVQFPGSIGHDEQASHRWHRHRLAPTPAAVVALEDVPLTVGERDVRRPERVHVHGIDVWLEVGRDTIGEPRPGETAVIRAEDAAL